MNRRASDRARSGTGTGTGTEPGQPVSSFELPTPPPLAQRPIMEARWRRDQARRQRRERARQWVDLLALMGPAVILLGLLFLAIRITRPLWLTPPWTQTEPAPAERPVRAIARQRFFR